MHIRQFYLYFHVDNLDRDIWYCNIKAALQRRYGKMKVYTVLMVYLFNNNCLNIYTYVYFFFDRALNLLVKPFGFSRFCIEFIAGREEAGLSGLFALFPLRPNFGLWTPKARRAPGRMSSMLLLLRLLD